MPRARHGSSMSSSPSLKWRIVNWQTVVARSGPCATPLIMNPQEPQMPSRQSCSNATGSSPRSISASFKHVQALEHRHVRIHVVYRIADKFALVVSAPFCRQTFSVSRITCSSSGSDARS